MYRKSKTPTRFRVGRVSVYEHHGAWWVHYRDDAGPHRKKVAADRDQAEQLAARVNAQLAGREPTLLAFTPVGVAELRTQFLNYHELVLHSSVATLKRYRSATRHLDDFARTLPRPPHAHELRVEAFAAYLRRVEVAPNGHANSARRRLLSKGARSVLETCRAMYACALKRRHLPPYAGNPFSELPLDKMAGGDAKPVFVFDAATEPAFLRACPEWAFPVYLALAKTGLRVGELVHLLVEDADFEAGWLHVRNKAELGWRVKTGRERVVPLVAEVAAVLWGVVAGRTGGPAFLREKFCAGRRSPGRPARAGGRVPREAGSHGRPGARQDPGGGAGGSTLARHRCGAGRQSPAGVPARDGADRPPARSRGGTRSPRRSRAPTWTR